MKPTLDVDVAEPEMSSPERVVVPKPVDETERNDKLVVLAAFVDDETLNSVVFVFPYDLNAERIELGVVVPTPTLPPMNVAAKLLLAPPFANTPRP